MNANDIQQKYPPKTKNELKKISDRWDTLQEAHSGLISWGSLEESAELNPWESDRNGEGARVIVTSTQNLANCIPVCSGAQAESAANSSAHQQR